jgi:hypothetical protein
LNKTFPFSIDYLDCFSKMMTYTWYAFQVEYDFKYYKMEMATDVQLLVLSEGKSNILPADVIVPIRPSATNSSEAVAAENLEVWRWYLASVRQLPHSFESETQKV